ncbi:ATP-grasp domain-containing protein [Ditylenchus destructor]|uniref:ATP-grasp domain-containing protein n=1 Tax=Ditylenchus destructor TaxID=166010 RepID=A0AAD4QT06_9BILA|nr:ATP-grasp domain-containing protein [Ditylenchus destructor]
MAPAALQKAQHIAQAVTADLGGQGLFGVELFVKGDEVWFSEGSPRPHDTGMVTMATQWQNEFELHARAILGLPVDNLSQEPGRQRGDLRRRGRHRHRLRRRGRCAAGARQRSAPVRQARELHQAPHGRGAGARGRHRHRPQARERSRLAREAPEVSSPPGFAHFVSLRHPPPGATPAARQGRFRGVPGPGRGGAWASRRRSLRDRCSQFPQAVSWRARAWCGGLPGPVGVRVHADTASARCLPHWTLATIHRRHHAASPGARPAGLHRGARHPADAHPVARRRAGLLPRASHRHAAAAARGGRGA